MLRSLLAGVDPGGRRVALPAVPGIHSVRSGIGGHKFAPRGMNLDSNDAPTNLNGVGSRDRDPQRRIGIRNRNRIWIPGGTIGGHLCDCRLLDLLIADLGCSGDANGNGHHPGLLLGFERDLGGFLLIGGDDQLAKPTVTPSGSPSTVSSTGSLNPVPRSIFDFDQIPGLTLFDVDQVCRSFSVVKSGVETVVARMRYANRVPPRVGAIDLEYESGVPPSSGAVVQRSACVSVCRPAVSSDSWIMRPGRITQLNHRIERRTTARRMDIEVIFLSL